MGDKNKGWELPGHSIEQTGLILDEATSALDNTTEREIIDSIFSSSTGQTLIMVAHRQNTLKHCNQYFRIEDGVIFKLNSLENCD